MPDLFIDNVKVEQVTKYIYIYIGTVLDNKSNVKANTDFINKKCQSRVYCLQQLRGLKFCKCQGITDILSEF